MFWGFLSSSLTVLSIHFSDVISFYLLRQDALFPAFNFLFDILIDFSYLCVTVRRHFSFFSYNSCCRIGTIGTIVFCNFDSLGTTESTCIKVFGLRTKKKTRFYFVEIYDEELIWCYKDKMTLLKLQTPLC